MSLLPAPSATRTLGGKNVSSLAWGMWRFGGDDVAAAQSLIEAVLDAGITLFDTADIYGFNGAQLFYSLAQKAIPKLNHVQRSEVRPPNLARMIKWK